MGLLKDHADCSPLSVSILEEKNKNESLFYTHYV